MDANSRHDSRSEDDADANPFSLRDLVLPDAQCIICRRVLSPETEVTEGMEAICICMECKIMVRDGNERSLTPRDIHRRRARRGGRAGSTESIEDLFSQQFSQLIDLVRQNHEAQIDGETAITVQQHARYSPAQGRVRRWQRAFSDNESDTLYQTDSLFGENDSNTSFGAYGESDASVDGRSLLDTEMIIQLDNESHAYTDTDIDPMHAGLDQWNSDDQDEDDGEWEEVDMDELAEQNEQIQVVSNPIGYSEREAGGRAWMRWRMAEHRRTHFAEIYAALEELETVPPYTANPGDYVDARGFEELLEQFAETGSSRRGAPPAAASFVAELSQVVISKEHEKNGSLVCAICKDLLTVNSEAKQLPCLHLYHPLCILPWLRTRNSCPVCRYELPTDDQEYEERKRNIVSNATHTEQQDPADEESSSDMSGGSEVDEDHVSSQGLANQSIPESINQEAHTSNREGGARRWLFLAAAPIVSIVGIALVLWFRSPVGDRMIQFNTREHNHLQLQRSRGTSALGGRNRRWWSLIQL